MVAETNSNVRQHFFNVSQVAELLACSERHAYRLVRSGTIPRPVKLGQLNRWPRSVIERWIEEGCPAVTELTSESSNGTGGGDHE